MGRKSLFFVGQRIDELTIVEKLECEHRNSVWLCRCSCGKTTRVSTPQLKRKLPPKIKSCGCKEAQSGCKKKYLIDETFFDNIDNEEKAYWLGFLAADGCVNAKNSTISIALATIDKLHLEKFKKSLKSNYPVFTYVRKKGYIDNSLFAKITVGSKQMSKKLIELGFVGNKAFTLKYPFFLSDNLQKHYNRGFIDGDGCFSVSDKNKSIEFNVLGSVSFCEDFQNVLVKNCGLNKTKIVKTKTDGLVRIRYGGTNNVRNLVNYLYQDATVFLERKHTKVKNFFDKKGGFSWA